MENTLNWLSNYRPIIESIYFICAPLLLIIAFRGLTQIRIGLKQLEISKEDIRIRSLREAATISAAQCAKFGDLLPTYFKLLEDCLRSGIPDYKGSTECFLTDELDENTKKWYKDFKSKVKENKETHREILRCLNYLETMSLYFNEGIADEILAFPVIGYSYCRLVERLIPYMAIPKEKHGSELYDPIMVLYKRWKARLDGIEYEHEAKRLKEKRKSLKPNHVRRPIGVNK